MADLPVSLLIISAAFAFAYGFHFTHQPASWVRSVCKTIPLTALALIAFTEAHSHFLWVALGLGAIGDAFLSRDGERNFLLGLGSFLVGHLLFALLFFQTGEGFPILANEAFRLLMVFCLLVLMFVVVTKIRPELGALIVPVFLYIGIIFFMGLAAVTIPATWPLGLVILGAMMFIASDALLAFELFVFADNAQRKRLTSPLLWFLYWGGQATLLMAYVPILA